MLWLIQPPAAGLVQRGSRARTGRHLSGEREIGTGRGLSGEHCPARRGRLDRSVSVCQSPSHCAACVAGEWRAGRKRGPLMLVVFAFALLILAAAVVILFAMLAELATRGP